MGSRKKKNPNARRGMRGKSSHAKHEYAKELRRDMSRPEKALWKHLRQKRLGVWVYAQQIVYGYIVDFWCPKAGIAIEVDGPHHARRKKADNKRDATLESKGIKTLRFDAKSAENNPAAVAALIKGRIQQRL